MLQTNISTKRFNNQFFGGLFAKKSHFHESWSVGKSLHLLIHAKHKNRGKLVVTPHPPAWIIGRNTYLI